ncbi:hypothetical protein FA15DRAFT_666826 [Coprinopsis marcescibilis]|uniref:Uncharacterized protein n=1 Tax=Coprinopsis marcescibilis TaxID=230819 RepID=A0A5C3L2U7_COPMA|nr:hypothetical protein FA15DRAFT_666826 [Coprinopsis marcescibilis]
MTTPVSNASSTSSLRWDRTGESTGFSNFGRGGRGRGGSRGGRGGRGGSRGGGTHREALDSRPEKAQSLEKPKPPAARPAPPKPSNDKAPSTPKAKPQSRRNSRAIVPAPISTQISSAPTELATPSSTSSSSSRRRRSQGGRGPNPKNINQAVTEDSLVGSGQPRLSSISQTNSIKDTPPHISTPKLIGTPVGMRTNIDALVERVRATAMAENRPSTPGSHIDWAGDDDDSLPDLDDWGISTTTSTSNMSGPAHTISPIIVDGLKPLPDPIVKAEIPPRPVHSGKTLLVPNARPNGFNRNNAKSTQLPKSNVNSNNIASPTGIKKGIVEPQATVTNQRKDANPANVAPGQVNADGKPSIFVSENNQRQETASVKPSTQSAGVLVSIPHTEKHVADSIHAPATAYDPLFGGIGNDEGLKASIHAPRGVSDAISAPANLSSYSNLPKPPHDSLHGFQKPRHGGRPMSFHSQNRNPRGGGFAGNNNHSRNHSSPSMSGNPRNYNHSRPVITGDAISRLARTIVATTPKPAAVANDAS